MTDVPTRSIHIKLPSAHQRLLDALCRTIGLDKTAVIKLALFELAVKHGIATEFKND